MRFTLAALLLVTLAGCSGSSNEPLRNADDVKASETAAAAREGKVGESIKLGNINVTVNSFALGGDDLGPWIVADLRIENTSDAEDSIPDAGIICGDKGEQGGYQADSTISLGDTLPAKSFKEGILTLMVAEDGRTGEAVPECATPASLQLTSSDSHIARVPIPDDLIAQVNAKRQQ